MRFGKNPIEEEVGIQKEYNEYLSIENLFG
jgi:hypothetical protein